MPFKVIKSLWMWLFLSRPISILSLSISSHCYTTLVLRLSGQEWPLVEASGCMTTSGIISCKTNQTLPSLIWQSVIKLLRTRIGLFAYSSILELLQMIATLINSNVTILAFKGAQNERSLVSGFISLFKSLGKITWNEYIPFVQTNHINQIYLH